MSVESMLRGRQILAACQLGAISYERYRELCELYGLEDELRTVDGSPVPAAMFGLPIDEEEDEAAEVVTMSKQVPMRKAG